MRLVALLACAAVLVPLAAVDPHDDPQIVRPVGTYSVMRIDLGDADDGRFARLILSLRDGRPVVGYIESNPQFVMLDLAGLAVEPVAVKGVVRGVGFVRNGLGHYVDVALDLAGDGQELQGTFQFAPAGGVGADGLEPRSGTARAQVVSEVQLRKEFGGELMGSWPSHLGPTGNLRSDPQPLLIGDLDRARLLWASERSTPNMPGMMNRGNGLNMMMNGGGATPVIADGKVFLWFHEANSDLLDEKAIATRMAKYESKSKGGEIRRPLLPEKFSVLADDVMICLDATTGTLLWETHFAKTCINNQEHKRGINNYSPTAGNGKMVAITGSGRLVCLDAADGSVAWKTPLPEGYAEALAKAIAGKSYLGSTFDLRGYGTSVTIHKDLVLYPRGSLWAYDLATGALRWACQGSRGNGIGAANIALGTVDGMEVAVAGNTVVDLADGNALYHLPVSIPNLGKPPTVVGDLLAGYLQDRESTDGPAKDGDEDEDEKERPLRLYRLHADHAELLWERSGDQAGVGKWNTSVLPIIRGARIFASSSAKLVSLSLTDGTPEPAVALPLVPMKAGHLIDLGGKFLVSKDGKHGKTVLLMADISDAGAITTEQEKPWAPSIRSTTSYHFFHTYPVVDGRIFIRAAEAILCYDLRAEP